MSHFTVLVIGDNVTEQLAPFDENIIMPRYIRETKEDLIEDGKKQIANFKNSVYAEYLSNPEKYRSECHNEAHLRYLQTEFPQKLSWTDEQIYSDVIKYYKPKDIDENGGVYSTRNPKSKWDWYVVGGRWEGLLTTKDNKEVDSDLFKNLKTPLPKTFAILKDGEWHERGKMGWWASVSNEMPEEDWEKKREELLSDISPDTLITIVDCHI